LPENDPLKINNLTGINDTFETPENPDLVINTKETGIDEARDKIVNFIYERIGL
jgi:adenylylsulfate kinase